MTDVLYLAWKYLAYHRFKTAILVASITVIVFLPAGLNILVNESSKQLTARAATTPLLVGAKGSPLELVLSSLYFDSDVPAPMRHAEVERIDRSGLARAIPIYARFKTRHSTIVGTSLDYFDYRELEVERGRRFGMLGECVLGAQAARMAQAKLGDSIMSTPEAVFDIAGVYPLKMKVVGVLRATGTPDDRAVFADVKTAWVIEGLAHGHQDLSQGNAPGGILRREGNKIIANASVMQFNEITSKNVASFHFHGDPDDFPVTSAIAIPADEKSGTLLQGRYLSNAELVQIVRPAQVMDSLLRTILNIRRYILIAVVLLGVATLATIMLVFMLSWQLRRRELETMMKIGAAKNRMTALVVTEILGVLVAGSVLAGLLSILTLWLATSASRLLVQLV